MFLNDILDNKWEFKDSGENPFNHDDIPTDDRLIRVDVNNIAQYLHDNPISGKFEEMFDVCLSPWEWVWTEYKCQETPLLSKVGCLHHTIMVDDPIKQANMLKITKESQSILMLSPPRFYMCTTMFVLRKDLGEIRLMGSFWTMYSNEGKLLNTIAADNSPYMDLNNDEELNGFISVAQGLITPPLFAFSLSHCKNIEFITDSVDLTKANHRRQINNKSLLYQYKSVKLSDATQKKYQRGELVDETDDRSVSFHICKGHFRTYTADNPLFGKLTGKFWIPQHTKGAKAVGTVVKEYVAEKSN